MNIDIREHVKRNFSNSKSDEIRAAIMDATQSKEEKALPGLGVFFEVLWENMEETEKASLCRDLSAYMKK